MGIDEILHLKDGLILELILCLLRQEVSKR